MKHIVTIDFETFYDTGYGLKKYTTEHYIRDGQFQVIGFAIKVDDCTTKWYSGTHEELQEVLDGYKIHECGLVAHNMQFDGTY
jgi:hypothetical protein